MNCISVVYVCIVLVYFMWIFILWLVILLSALHTVKCNEFFCLYCEVAFILCILLYCDLLLSSFFTVHFCGTGLHLPYVWVYLCKLWYPFYQLWLVFDVVTVFAEWLYATLYPLLCFRRSEVVICLFKLCFLCVFCVIVWIAFL